MNAAAHMEAFFLPGTSGNLFSLYHPPSNQNQQRCVLVVPPFAEEMNKSRRMLSLQASSLAAAGIGVLMVDLYGTGDSEGDFGDARWQIWLEDLACARQWLQDKGINAVSLLAVRMGALLALESASDWGDKVDRLVFWQPISRGEVMLTQFLRLRVAANMMGSGSAETTKGLKARLAAGEHVEVAGYDLASELAQEVENKSLAAVDMMQSIPIHWLEVSSKEAGSVSPAANKLISTWREKGLSVTARGVKGEPFWATQEIATAPELLDVTTELLSG